MMQPATGFDFVVIKFIVRSGPIGVIALRYLGSKISIYVQDKCVCSLLCSK